MVEHIVPRVVDPSKTDKRYVVCYCLRLTGNVVPVFCFPAKQPPPATVTLVAGGGGLMQNPLDSVYLMS